MNRILRTVHRWSSLLSALPPRAAGILAVRLEVSNVMKKEAGSFGDGARPPASVGCSKLDTEAEKALFGPARLMRGMSVCSAVFSTDMAVTIQARAVSEAVRVGQRFGEHAGGASLLRQACVRTVASRCRQSRLTRSRLVMRRSG